LDGTVPTIWKKNTTLSEQFHPKSNRKIIKLKHLTDIQNLQVKLVSNKSGFNQIDKRCF
jgi:hypothetical protein